MKITLDYRDPTPTHCAVAVFINGALTGILKLRQDEICHFQMVLNHGLSMKEDYFISTGNPNWEEKL